MIVKGFMPNTLWNPDDGRNYKGALLVPERIGLRGPYQVSVICHGGDNVSVGDSAVLIQKGPPELIQDNALPEGWRCCLRLVPRPVLPLLIIWSLEVRANQLFNRFHVIEAVFGCGYNFMQVSLDCVDFIE